MALGQDDLGSNADVGDCGAARRSRGKMQSVSGDNMNMADVNERRRIYLMRHAEVEYFTATGAPVDPRAVTLTARGRDQATAMASALADVPFDRAVCSAMPRSHETAAAILTGREDIAIEQEP